MESLSLEGEEIRHLGRDLFRGVDKLMHLNLADNQLFSLQVKHNIPPLVLCLVLLLYYTPCVRVCMENDDGGFVDYVRFHHGNERAAYGSNVKIMNS